MNQCTSVFLQPMKRTITYPEKKLDVHHVAEGCRNVERCPSVVLAVRTVDVLWVAVAQH